MLDSARAALIGPGALKTIRLRAGSLVAIALYAVIAVLVLDRACAIDVVPDVVSAVGTWVVVAFLVLEIGLNAMSRSKPERIVMVPVSATLAVLSLLVALAGSG